MLNLFARRQKRDAFVAAGPAGRLIYAIGDIHGRADLLSNLVARLRRDAESVAGRPTLVLLGDYVDRGPQSREVLDMLVALEHDELFETVALRGNHDQFILDFLEDGASGGAWLQYGGGPTLTSYGISPPLQRTDRDAWRQASAALAGALPPEHLDFLRRTKLSLSLGDYFFVHAGVRPGVKLSDQQAWDLMSIRKPFLASREPLAGRVVVFGHTAMNAPLVEPGKIGLDTGAYATGVLTALRIFETDRRFISTGSAAAAA